MATSPSAQAAILIPDLRADRSLITAGTSRDERERSTDRSHPSERPGMSRNVKNALVNEALCVRSTGCRPESSRHIRSMRRAVGLEPTSPCGQRFSRPRSAVAHSHDLFCARLNLPIRRGVQPDPSRTASSSFEKGMSRECHSERASFELAGCGEAFTRRPPQGDPPVDEQGRQVKPEGRRTFP